MNLFVFINLSLVVRAMMMNMPIPNAPGTICTGILGNIYQFAGVKCRNDTYAKASCYCVDPRFSLSVVACIDQFMVNITESNRTSQKLKAYKTFQKRCPKITVHEMQNMEANITHLEEYSGRSSGIQPGKWPVHSAFKLTEQEIWDGVQAFNMNNGAEHMNNRYGAGLVAYWGGIMFVRFLVYWGTSVFPLAAHYVGNSRLGRLFRKRLQIMNVKGNLVSVLQSLIVFGFAVLLVTFTFADLPYYYPNYNWRYSDMATYGTQLGMRSGVLALYNLPLLFLFAGRNNFMQWLTGWTQEPFLFFHRWIARAEVFLVIVHGIAYSFGRGGVNRYILMWGKNYWCWGVAGAAFASFLFVQAFRYFRQRFYEIFLVCHIVAAVLFLVSGYRHVLTIAVDKLAYNYFYASFAVWGLDRALRLIRLLFSGRHQSTISLEDENMVVVTFNQPRWWRALYSPGSYVFLHFVTPTLFWQSHPFTITTSTTDPTKIKLFCRVKNGITGQLAQQLKASGKETMQLPVLLDGPYGHTHDLFEYDDCIFIAGSSGIAVPFAYIQSNIHLFKNPFQKFVVHWAVRDTGALAWFEDELRFLRDQDRVELNIYFSHYKTDEKTMLTSSSGERMVKNAEIITVRKEETKCCGPREAILHIGGRLNISAVLHETISSSKGPLSVMCCGPESMHLETRKVFAECMNLTPNYTQYYEETFTCFMQEGKEHEIFMKCSRCDAEATIEVRGLRFCNDCYYFFINRKFRIAMNDFKVNGAVQRAQSQVKPTSHKRPPPTGAPLILVFVSYGMASIALVDLLLCMQESQREKSRGMCGFEMRCVHISTDNEEEKQDWPWPDLPVHIEPCFKLDDVLKDSHLKQSRSTKHDMRTVLVRQTALSLTRSMNATAVFGYSVTKLTELTLAETVKGRGAAIPALVSPDLFEHRAIYPMKEILIPEIKQYCDLRDITKYAVPEASVPGITRMQSIDEIVHQYFVNVQKDFPSVVSTVSKVASRLNQLAEPCALCGPLVDESEDIVDLCYACRSALNRPRLSCTLDVAREFEL